MNDDARYTNLMNKLGAIENLLRGIVEVLRGSPALHNKEQK